MSKKHPGLPARPIAFNFGGVARPNRKAEYSISLGLCDDQPHKDVYQCRCVIEIDGQRLCNSCEFDCSSGMQSIAWHEEWSTADGQTVTWPDAIGGALDDDCNAADDQLEDYFNAQVFEMFNEYLEEGQQ
jgi:hypothetical protein